MRLATLGTTGVCTVAPEAIGSEVGFGRMACAWCGCEWNAQCLLTSHSSTCACPTHTRMSPLSTRPRRLPLLLQGTPALGLVSLSLSLGAHLGLPHPLPMDSTAPTTRRESHQFQVLPLALHERQTTSRVTSCTHTPSYALLPPLYVAQLVSPWQQARQRKCA